MSTLAFNMGPAVPIYQEHAHGPATTAIPELKTVFMMLSINLFMFAVHS